VWGGGGGRGGPAPVRGGAGRRPAPRGPPGPHAGHADPWVAALAPPAKPPVVVLGVVIALVCCATTLLLGVPVWFGMLGVVLAVPSVLLANAFLRRSVRRKPINAVLPAIPVTQGAVPTEQPPA